GRDGSAEMSGSIARAPFIAGEPILEQKLVKGDGSGFMAAILPTGMRAISTEISPETGAGGFILPNDRVDVILSRREKNPDRTGQPDIILSATILSNVRVLAIDQTPKEKHGHNVGAGSEAGIEAGAGREAGAGATGRHALAGAAQHHRPQRRRGRSLGRSTFPARLHRQCHSFRRSHSNDDDAEMSMKTPDMTCSDK